MTVFVVCYGIYEEATTTEPFSSKALAERVASYLKRGKRADHVRVVEEEIQDDVWDSVKAWEAEKEAERS